MTKRRNEGAKRMTLTNEHLPAPSMKVLPFRAPYAPPDEDIAAEFLKAAPFDAAAEARIDARAGGLVAAIRANAGRVGGVEDFLRE